MPTHARAIHVTLAVLGALTLLPNSAEAQPNRQLTEEQRRLLRQLVHPPVRPQLTLSAEVETAGGAELLTGSGQPLGQARLALELAYESRLCRHFGTGAAASLLADPVEQAPEVEQWLSVCLIGGLPLPSLELDHHIAWRRRPAFDAPRLMGPGRHVEEKLGLTVTLLDVPFRQARLQFGRSRVGVNLTFFEDPATPDGMRMSVHMSSTRYLLPRFGPLGRGDLSVEVVAIDLEDLTGEVKDALAMTMLPLRLRGVRLGTPRLLLDAAAGAAYGGISPTYDPDRPVEEIPDEERRQIITPAFEVALYGGGARLAGGIGLRRQLRPALSDELLIESRATAWIRYRRPRFFALLDGFFALSEVRPFARADEDHLTGGGRLQLGWSPVERAGRRHTFGLWLKLSGELARSFFGASRPSASLAPELGGRVLASISASYDLGP